jgi:hypothetical protein
MNGFGADSVRAPARLVALAIRWLGTAGCGDERPAAESTRGRGPLVSQHSEITACETAVYEGPETRLYSNRPYHTEQTANTARGLTFCRGERHGTSVWTIEVLRPTRLVVFGVRGDGLEDRGWTPSEEPLEVAAEGVPLDRIYTREFPVGKYVIRQGFTRAAPIVLWDSAAAQPSP